MRIGLVCPYHMFKGGGVQECVKALYDEYTKKGHYVKIITPEPRDYEGEIPDYIITLGASGTTTAFAGTAWHWSVSVDTDAIDEVFSREKFDILHFHEPWIPLWSRQLVVRSQSINIATMHGRFFDTMTAKTLNAVITPYTKPMIKYFEVFTAVSPAATEYFRTLSSKPVTIVPNGIDIAKYSTAPPLAVRHPHKKTIFYVGRLEARKGIKFLLRAFATLAEHDDNVQLTIAGDGPDMSKLRTFVDENNIPQVTFLGYISEEDKIRHLHRSDVFCSPARYGESFGIVLLEAMAAGIPVIAGDNVGYQSVMQNTGALSLVNPQDTVDFARRLEMFIYNDDIRSLWIKWAKAYVQGFKYTKIADMYLDVYKKAAATHERKTKA